MLGKVAQQSTSRHRIIANLILLGCLALCAGCTQVKPVHAEASVEPAAFQSQSPQDLPDIRATGTIQAVRAFTVQVPQISGLVGQNNFRPTLVKLVPNGTRVKKDDLLAEFDRTAQIDAAIEAKAKYENLTHQVREKAAKNDSDAAKRSADIRQAEGDLAKAEIQLKKGPVLSEIDRLKNEEKARNARARVESLQKSDKSRRIAESASLEILKLQMERQKVALERSDRNAEALVLKAPLDGMVALENIWRGGSMGNAQEGDQLGSGQALLKIFDPTTMEVRTQVGEPDGAVLQEGVTATVYLDAYPDAVFKARFHSASPVATAALGSPIRNFSAIFRVDASDPRLLPDLSAAVIVHGGAKLGELSNETLRNHRGPVAQVGDDHPVLRPGWRSYSRCFKAYKRSNFERPADSPGTQGRFQRHRAMPWRIESAPIGAGDRARRMFLSFELSGSPIKARRSRRAIPSSDSIRVRRSNSCRKRRQP